jgi:hypothetical protein
VSAAASSSAHAFLTDIGDEVLGLTPRSAQRRDQVRYQHNATDLEFVVVDLDLMMPDMAAMREGLGTTA